MTSAIDPDVLLLSDAPIGSVAGDVLGHARVAQRLVELACAGPVGASRTVGLTGGPGTGRTSLLALAREHLTTRPEVVVVALDAGEHPSADALLGALLDHFTEFFTAAGVLEKSTQVRDKLAGYVGAVSGVAKLAGVSVDPNALKRSPAAVRAELLQAIQVVGQRFVVTIDHVDRMDGASQYALLRGLHHSVAIPYITVVLAVDPREVVRRIGATIGGAAGAEVLARVLQVELAVPPCERVVLARVIAGGLVRLGERLDRDVDALLPLFDPEHDGRGLLHVRTLRDAKRAVNALSANLPLWPADVDLAGAAVDLLDRLLSPST